MPPIHVLYILSHSKNNYYMNIKSPVIREVSLKVFIGFVVVVIKVEMIVEFVEFY